MDPPTDPTANDPLWIPDDPLSGSHIDPPSTPPSQPQLSGPVAEYMLGVIELFWKRAIDTALYDLATKNEIEEFVKVTQLIVECGKNDHWPVAAEKYFHEQVAWYISISEAKTAGITGRQ